MRGVTAVMSGGGGIDPRHMTQWIKNTRSVEELLALHEAHYGSLNDIHISAAWTTLSRHLATNARASKSRAGYTRYRPIPASMYATLLPLMRQTAAMALAGDLTGRELANVMYGVARSRLPE